MTDIVERLRGAAAKPNGWAILGADAATEAAAEIESLRSRLAEAKAKADKDVIARNRVIAEKSARLAEAEVLLMEAREFVFGLTRIDDLRDRIDAHLARQP